MDRKYLSCAETAKLVRAALKKAFPQTKFSVRSDSYAGGASIRVGWTDGPTGKMVEAVAKQFQGGGFDGMIDMKYSGTSWLLPDGSATWATCEGTQGSGGTVAPIREWMPHPEAKLVRFGADFVFCDREYSERFLRHACARLARNGYQQFAAAEIETTKWGSVVLKDGFARCAGGDIDMGTALHRECVNLMVV